MSFGRRSGPPPRSATETIAYDMPALRSPAGRFLVSYAAYKAHTSLFPASDAVVAACGAELTPYLSGRGTIRFPIGRPIPLDLVRRVVEVRWAENADAGRAPDRRRRGVAMTYSIVARDPTTGELGVAVQTRWFNVGETVPWAEPGVGAVATQSFSLKSYGPLGLERMRVGETAPEALAALVAADEGRDVRQVGMVDAAGGSAAHTGARCVVAAGHVTAPDLSIQANMMERPSVWPAMAAAYGSATGDLADRLLAALRAAEAEGGDVRGRQSAALLVVPAVGDRWQTRFDLRIEDDRAPLDELGRLLRVARAYEAFDRANERASAGDLRGAGAAMDEAHALAPDDDQISLWTSLSWAAEGRREDARALFAEARAVEPRGGEHLRRFLAAGLLPDPLGPVISDLIRETDPAA